MFPVLNEAKFLATSTPLRQTPLLEDSGYFGSGARDERLGGDSSFSGEFPSFCYALSGNSASFSDVNNDHSNFQTDVKEGRSHRTEGTRSTSEIEFSDDGCIIVRSQYYETLGKSELNFKNLKSEKPECGGPKRRKVDFIKELRERNCLCVVSQILCHLSGRDLHSASCVCGGWREAILEDRSADLRRRRSILEARRDRISAASRKENVLGRHDVGWREHKTAFSDVTNSSQVKKQPLHTETDARFQSYLQIGENLAKGEVLKQCPRCKFAAKPQNKAYVCSSCSYTFCQERLARTHTQIPSLIIGSKQSRRNLRRL